MAMFPFAPVQGPNGMPLPPGPATVLARIEDAVRETTNDVVETITGTAQASGTNTATVTSPSGAQGTATFDENVVTVEEYNKGMETLAKRIAKLSGQVAQLRTGMLANQSGVQGWDGAISWEQYQAQYGGGGNDMSQWMPMIITLLLLQGSGGSAIANMNPAVSSAMLFMLPGLAGGMGNAQMNFLLPVLLVSLLKK